MSTSTTIGRQANEGVQLDSVGMLVKYGESGFIYEGGIDPTRIGDVGDDSILALDYYEEWTKVEYSSEHEESMRYR